MDTTLALTVNSVPPQLMLLKQTLTTNGVILEYNLWMEGFDFNGPILQKGNGSTLSAMNIIETTIAGRVVTITTDTTLGAQDYLLLNLWDIDSALGGSGNSVIDLSGLSEGYFIQGGGGADTLHGSGGADTFDFNQGDSTPVTFDVGTRTYTFTGGADVIIGGFDEPAHFYPPDVFDPIYPEPDYLAGTADHISLHHKDGILSLHQKDGIPKNVSDYWGVAENGLSVIENPGLYAGGRLVWMATPDNGLVNDGHYFLERGDYSSGIFTVTGNGADTLVVYDGDSTSAISQAALVLKGVNPTQLTPTDEGNIFRIGEDTTGPEVEKMWLTDNSVVLDFNVPLASVDLSGLILQKGNGSTLSAMHITETTLAGDLVTITTDTTLDICWGAGDYLLIKPQSGGHPNATDRAGKSAGIFKDVDFALFNDTGLALGGDSGTVIDLSGLSGPYTIQGGYGDDTFTGTASNNFILGGEGIDTLILSGLPSQYLSDAPRSDGVNMLIGIEGTDTIHGIEFYRFGTSLGRVSNLTESELMDPDGTGPADSPATELLQGISDLYLAYFNRAPDVGGLMYWFGEVMDGSSWTLATVAQSFVDQSEYTATYAPGLTNRAFVEKIYQNLFAREPDPGGWDFWENDLNHGMARDTFLYTVIQAASAPTGNGSDKALLTNKHDVSLYYSEQLATHPSEGFDGKIDQVLNRITADAHTVVRAEAVIDYVIDNPITLTGLVSDTVAWEAFWV